MNVVKITVRPVVEENHHDISVISMGNEVIGYICPNHDRNREVKPFSAVDTDGDTLGDFSSFPEAANFTVRYHLDFQEYSVIRKEMTALVENLFNDASQKTTVH
ncbi:hypothetical protein QI600_003463 [Salmonella enterica]|nr:hypothetical protein [Salmonella enterica]